MVVVRVRGDKLGDSFWIFMGTIPHAAANRFISYRRTRVSDKRYRDKHCGPLLSDSWKYTK